MSMVTALFLEWKASAGIGAQTAGDFLRLYSHVGAHLDWAGAGRLRRHLPREPQGATLREFCLDICEVFVVGDGTLTSLAGRGREALVSSLAVDEEQVFRAGGLLESIPDELAANWWDRIRSVTKLDADARKVAQGRRAERWTIEHEKARLLSAGVTRDPVWVALESDAFGFDVLSYRVESSENVRNLLIEVKSYADEASPSFYLTRGEWKKAEQAGEDYIFHVWNAVARELRVVTVEEVGPNVPVNQGKGDWQSVLIQLEC